MTKSNRSRKTIRPKKARTRTDHPAGCRVNADELATVRGDIDAIAQTSGIKPSLGSYTKHALLSYPRYRRLEVGLRKLLADDAPQAIDVDTMITRKLIGLDLDQDTYDRVREAVLKEFATILSPCRKFHDDVKSLLEGL